MRKSGPEGQHCYQALPGTAGQAQLSVSPLPQGASRVAWPGARGPGRPAATEQGGDCRWARRRTGVLRPIH